MKDEADIRYEMLRVGDLVQYNDPIPEDIMMIMPPGLVIEVSGVNYVRVWWLADDIKAGLYLRRELKLLSRVPQIEKNA